MLQACLNGGHPPATGVATTPGQLAAVASAAVAAGARELHLHPRDAAGHESLRAHDVLPSLAAIREAVPGVPLSVTTREEACPDPAQRLRLLASWPGPAAGGPDLASVNWHELGALAAAGALREAGIGVEAGLWTAASAASFLGTTWPGRVARVLVEAVPGHSPGRDGVWAAERVLAALGRQQCPVLVHGEGSWTWPVLRWARRYGYQARIGPEDTLVDESGRPSDIGAMVTAALRPTASAPYWPAPSP